MDQFLNQSKEPGQLVQRNQRFSLSPQRARETILGSAPPDEDTVFKGMLFLADALSLIQGGMAPSVVESGTGYPPFLKLSLPLRSSWWLTEERRHWLKDRFESPFSSTEPAALAWDRGWTRLLSTGAKVQIRVGSVRKGDFWGVELSKGQGWLELEPPARFLELTDLIEIMHPLQSPYSPPT